MNTFFHLCLLGLFCLTQSVKSQEASIETVKINDHFYVLYGGNGQGSNVGVLIQDEGLLLVDAMVEESGQKLMAAIRAISDKPVKYVFNTHGDFDHSGCNGLFAEQGAVIIAHDFAGYNGVTANATFSESFSLNFGNETIHAWHSPSHSHSDITIYFENQNAVFLGDTFSNTWHPTFYATGMAGQYEVIDQLHDIANEETVIIPGHGYVTDLTDINHYKEGCQLWMKRMTELASEHKGLEAMIADPTLKALRQRFINNRAEGDMPDMNFQRLIQRTLSSEFVAVKPLSALALQKYTGAFQDAEGSITRVFIWKNRLMAAVEGKYITELLPLDNDRFHLRAWIDHHFTFHVDQTGKVASVDHERSDGTRNLSAVKQ